MHLFSSVVMISKWRQCRHFRSVRWFLCFSFVAFFFHSPFCIHLYVYYFLLINISIYVRAAVTNVSCHWFLSNEDRHCPSRLVLVSPFLLNDCFRELIILRLCWYRLKCQNSFPFIFCWFKEYIFFKPDLFQAGSRISELRITEWKATIIFRHRCSTVAPTFLFLSFFVVVHFLFLLFFFSPETQVYLLIGDTRTNWVSSVWPTCRSRRPGRSISHRRIWRFCGGLLQTKEHTHWRASPSAFEPDHDNIPRPHSASFALFSLLSFWSISGSTNQPSCSSSFLFVWLIPSDSNNSVRLCPHSVFFFRHLSSASPF